MAQFTYRYFSLNEGKSNLSNILHSWAQIRAVTKQITSSDDDDDDDDSCLFLLTESEHCWSHFALPSPDKADTLKLNLRKQIPYSQRMRNYRDLDNDDSCQLPELRDKLLAYLLDYGLDHQC